MKIDVRKFLLILIVLSGITINISAMIRQTFQRGYQTVRKGLTPVRKVYYGATATTGAVAGGGGYLYERRKEQQRLAREAAQQERFEDLRRSERKYFMELPQEPETEYYQRENQGRQYVNSAYSPYYRYYVDEEGELQRESKPIE